MVAVRVRRIRARTKVEGQARTSAVERLVTMRRQGKRKRSKHFRNTVQLATT